MEEIYQKVKSKTKLKIFFGISLIIIGFLFHLIPLVPGSWAIFIGLEILGIRLLLQNKLKDKFKNLKIFNKLFNTQK